MKNKTSYSFTLLDLNWLSDISNPTYCNTKDCHIEWGMGGREAILIHSELLPFRFNEELIEQ